VNRTAVIFTLVMVIGFAAQTALAEQTVYKWKDSAGNLHYTQQPPVGIASEAISVKEGYSTRNDAAREPTPEELQAAEKAELCRVATRNFEMLSGPGSLMRRDEYGQDHTLTDEEKTSERDRAKAAMEQHCPPSN
jgi:hypothetical protein